MVKPVNPMKYVVFVIKSRKNCKRYLFTFFATILYLILATEMKHQIEYTKIELRGDFFSALAFARVLSHLTREITVSLACSRRSVFWGAARKTASEK